MEPKALDNLDQLKQAVHEGRIGADRLVDLLATVQQQLAAAQQQLAAAQQQLAAAQQRITELEIKAGKSPTEKVAKPYSLREEEKRQEARGLKHKSRKGKSKKRRGRVTSQEKIQLAERTEKVFPQGVPPGDCKLSHTRPVWRLENGRAVLVAYEIYRGPQNQYGKIPGVLGRSEYGPEILIEIAHLVYVVKLSLDKVCALLQFFQNLRLSKAQVNALLYRLARHWEHEFEVLCTLLANAAVVHADETSWSIHSVWAFLSEKARVVFFGVHKDADTLKEILDPATFAGIMISDDAAVYAHFTAAQKCWAHLLRKAIKLTLLDPDNLEYRQFTDRLLAIYHEACRVQRDGRLGDTGRAQKVADLDDEVLALCLPMCSVEWPPLQGAADDYRLLTAEVLRLMLAQELFTFVTAPPVQQPNGATQPLAGTNNEAERTLRDPAEARDIGRTSKTLYGARRQTILTSILESLRLYLPAFTLGSVVDEVQRWQKAGRSCFTDLLHKLQLKVSSNGPSTLERIYRPLLSG